MPLGSAKVGLFGAAGTAVGGQRGIYYAGAVLGDPSTDVMQYITINSVGNSTDFGDLIEDDNSAGGTSNGTNDRGIRAGGYDSISNTSNIIQYITMSTPGDATDFGDMFGHGQYGKYAAAHVSNGTNERAVFMGGGNLQTPYYYNSIDYVTINSTGNAADFGDITTDTNEAAAMSNGTDERGITFAGLIGAHPNNIAGEVIEYITINSAGDATDFGDAVAEKGYIGGLSNDTSDRGIAAGGSKTADSPRRHNVISYITITSTGDAADFGDLLQISAQKSGVSNGTAERGVFAGGSMLTGQKSNIIEYITINSAGNSTDFGDLLTETSAMGCTGSSDAAQ